ncbi:hypothetical protein ACFE04_002606 [Oxalis oulophora]
MSIISLTTLGTTLAVIFALSLLILIANLLYVFLWRRRQTNTVEYEYSSLYNLFFNWKLKPSRIEPDGSNNNNPTSADGDDDDDDVAKWQQGVFGGDGRPSRCLFTITEEEEEKDTDLESNKSKVSLSEFFQAADCRPVKVNVVDGDAVNHCCKHETTTPYATPCASPPYYTPSPSPIRDETMSFDAVQIQIS